MAREMLNVRVEQWLSDLIDRAVEASGAASKSQWARDALEAGARREIAAAETQQQPRRKPAPLGMSEVRRFSCTHPSPARQKNARAEFCGLCGTVTRLLA